MPILSRTYVLSFSLLLSCACGDSGSSGAGGSGTTGSGTGAAEDTSPQAPFLDTVAALHGALHLVWTNETTDCDAIEAERSVAEQPFELIFSVDGDVDDRPDDDATDPSTLYTYRLRCKKGDVYSPYSNEDARSPKPLVEP